MNKVELRNIIGSNIRRERIARNMSLDDLAYHLELTSGFLGLIEHGNRGATAYTLYKLTQIFEVTITTNTPSQKAMNNFNAQLGKLLFKYATE